MYGLGINPEYIGHRVRACDYLSVAQLYLKSNFLLEKPLSADDIKPRLLGHWGTCHGINLAYANLKYVYGNNYSTYANPDTVYANKNAAHANKNSAYANTANNPNFTFILGPGHGFPALQANLFLDGDLAQVDDRAKPDADGIAYICKNFSWPGGFPSHASPVTPGVICEGGELGYALATAYGAALGHPEKTVAVLIGDGEFETATALASLNLAKLLGTDTNGKVLPILHLNGYKISGPTVAARKSERELLEQLRGFGYTPIIFNGENTNAFQDAIESANNQANPFLIMKSEKGKTGPTFYHNEKIAGNYLSHQIPLKHPKTDEAELNMLSDWLKSYHFEELFNKKEGFTL